MRTARSAQRFPLAAVGTSERAKITREFALEFGPSLREVRVLVAMWFIRNVICLADVSGSGIRFAVRRMITQWFHSLFGTFVNSYGIVVATHCLRTEPLEFVNTRVRTISTFQHSFKWIIWSVWRSFDAHDVSLSSDPIPLMRIPVHAQRLVGASVRSRVCTKLSSEFILDVCPTFGEIRVLVKMWGVCHVGLLANVTRFRIIFAV